MALKDKDKKMSGGILMKKLTTIFSAIVVCLTLMAGVSSAADTWSACTPKAIGPYGNVVRIGLTNCNIAPQHGVVDQGTTWLSLSTTGTDQMMAAILTAMSLNLPVAIKTDGTVDGAYGVATAVLLSK